MAPNTFLVLVEGQPAGVDQTGDWNTILTQKEQVGNVAVDGEDVSIVISIIREPADRVWSLTFSSVKNAAAFANQAMLTVNTLRSNAWVGDDLNCRSSELKQLQI
jgi:hypothetical protein